MAKGSKNMVFVCLNLPYVRGDSSVVAKEFKIFDFGCLNLPHMREGGF